METVEIGIWKTHTKQAFANRYKLQMSLLDRIQVAFHIYSSPPQRTTIIILCLIFLQVLLLRAGIQILLYSDGVTKRGKTKTRVLANED